MITLRPASNAPRVTTGSYKALEILGKRKNIKNDRENNMFYCSSLISPVVTIFQILLIV